MAIAKLALASAMQYSADGNKGLPCMVVDVGATIGTPANKIIAPGLMTVTIGPVGETEIEAGATIWMNKTGIAYRILSACVCYGTAATGNDIDIEVLDDGEDPTGAAGVSIFATPPVGDGAVDTLHAGTLSSTPAERDVADGQRIAASETGDLNPIAECYITVVLMPKTLITASETE